MAMTIGAWGNPKTDRRCWWLRDGRMCLLPLMFHKLGYVCPNGHETTREEFIERKRK